MVAQIRAWMFIGWLLGTVAGVGFAQAAGQDTKSPPRPTLRLMLLDTLTSGGAGADEASSAHRLLVEALESLEHIQLTDPATLAKEEVPEAVRADQLRASDYIRKGRESLQNKALEDAMDSFQTARVALRKQMQWQQDPGLLISALMGLAEALASSENPEGASEAYHEVLVLSPEYEPDPGQVPAPYRSLFDDVRNRSFQEMTGKLSVESRPEGATVILDGLTLGQTPVERTKVMPGLHTLRIVKPGYRTARMSVEVLPGDPVRISEELSPNLVHNLVQRIHGSLSGRQETKEAPGVMACDLARITGLEGIVLSQAARVDQHQVLTVAVVTRANATPYRFGTRIQEDQKDQVGRILAFQISDALDKGQDPGPAPGDLGLDFSRHLLGEPRLVSLVKLPGRSSVQAKVPDSPRAKLYHPGLVPPADSPPPADEHLPLWKKWWFWAGAGTLVAVAVGTTLAFALEGDTQIVHGDDRIHIQMDRILP